MSKIGKKPIQIEEGATVSFENDLATIVGPKGTMEFNIPLGIQAKIVEGKIIVSQKNPSKDLRPMFGLTRAILANMVRGVTKGFEKRLELTGVGYRAQVAGQDLMLSVGYSHQVKISGVKGITFAVVDNTIVVSGRDPVLVGDMSARIRAVRPPEPYKGKGIKYVGERIRRKAGKAAKAVGGTAK